MTAINQNCWVVRHAHGARNEEYRSSERAAALMLFNQLTTDAFSIGPSGVLSLVWFDSKGKESSLMTVEIN